MFKCSAIILAALLAVPQAQAAASVPLADFARHMQYDEVKISPDGKKLAAISLIEGRRHLTLLDLGTMQGGNIKARDGDEIVEFDWVSPNRVVYSLGLKRSGVERPIPTGELFAVNANGGSGVVLHSFRSGAQQTGSKIKKVVSERASAHLIDELRDDDKFILVALNNWDGGTEGDYSKLVRMNTENGARTPLGSAPVRSGTFLTDHNGVIRFAWADDVKGKLEVYYRQDDKAKWELVLSEAATGDRAFPKIFQRDNQQVYWLCAPAGAVAGLCLWSPAERKFETKWSSKTVDIESLVTSFDGLDVVGVRSMPGRIALSPLMGDDATIKIIVELMKQFPGDDVRIASSTPDGSKAIVLVSGDVNPGEYYLLDAATNKLTFLLAKAPWIKPDQLAVMEPFVIKSRDGLALNGYLTRPPGKEEAKNLPLVVLPHGGPHGVRDEWTYDPDVQALAARGYAVLQLNFRGSSGYGHSFMTSGYREWGRKMQDDLTDATHWAIESGVADAKRICIYGISYGAYAALQGVVREPDLYQCAIGDAGPYDLALMFTRGDVQKSLYGTNELRKFIGEDKQEWAQRSPAAQAGRIKAKVMLISGGQDERVPPAHAEAMRAALVRNKAAPEWLYQRTEGHSFYNEANRTDRFEKIIAFLDSNIGPSAAK